MRSLRFRLILGSCLVAVVPLAVTMFVLSKRIETMVRAQAEERLANVLGSLESELVSDGKNVEEKLSILTGDPSLRRLYLVRPAGVRDLSEYLTERRKLLGLDFLQVADSTGKFVGEGPTDFPDLILAASFPIRYEGESVGLLRGGFFLDRSFLERLKHTSGIDLILADGNGQVMAATFADSVPVAPGEKTVAKGTVFRASIGGVSYLAQSFQVPIGSAPRPSMTGLISTAPADRTISGLQVTSVLIGILGLGLAVFLGVLWSSQISRPVERLAEFSRQVAEGNWEEPLTLRSVRELETLVTALDHMRQDLRGYRARLVTSERHAAWSLMARKVAHEVKNPLTPIAVSVADLQRSYEQKREDFPAILDQAVRTIGEEVNRLKRLLQEFSEFSRFPPPRFEPCRVSDLFSDLGTLYGGDVSQGRLVLSPPAALATFSADPAQMRQALMNLLQNGLEAGNGKGRVVVSSRTGERDLEISVSDDGPGLTAEETSRLFLPGFTTKKEGSGLGLVIVERIVSDHGGTITVLSQPGRGTTFTLRLPLEHRD